MCPPPREAGTRWRSLLMVMFLTAILFDSCARLVRISPELFVLAVFIVPPSIVAMPALWWGSSTYFYTAILALLAWVAVVLISEFR